MIDFKLCRKCGGAVHTIFGEDGEMEVLPTVICRVNSDMLLMKENPPEGCPYDLEHRLLSQVFPHDFVNRMSGGKYASKI